MTSYKRRMKKGYVILSVLVFVILLGGVAVYAYSSKNCPWHIYTRMTPWTYEGEHYHSGQGKHTYVYKRYCPLGDYTATRRDVYDCQGTGNGDCNLQILNIEDKALLDDQHHH